MQFQRFHHKLEIRFFLIKIFFPQRRLEFPAVLFNVYTSEVENDFHQYVRPTVFPYLTNYIKNKTGISQYDVDEAAILEDVLNDFNYWVDEICYYEGVELPTSKYLDDYTDYMVICTWSGSDLGTFLRHEAIYKNIDVPDYLKIWVDAQKVAMVNIILNQIILYI